MRLDTARHRLDGRTRIVYRSGADSALTAIHLHTYPNAFAGRHTLYAGEARALGEDYRLWFAKPSERGWMTLDSATVDGIPARVTVEETLARVDLPRPLAPGDSVALDVRFAVQVPIHFDRLGRTGSSYSIAQWYPKMVVYDERGWALDPFHYVAEFYGEYATYDVAITVPDGHWVGATGVLRHAEGGDNEIPLFESETPRDSVTAAISVILADSLAGRWPAGGLEIETDLFAPGAAEPLTFQAPSDRALALRVPRGAPVHYVYRWAASERSVRDEADREGRPGPLRLILASGDTAWSDTLRALATESAPGDTVLPSLKTMRFHAERVHDFAWVASPHYVRSDTTWSGISVRALVYREDAETWRDVKAWTVDALRHFTRLVGPYVWPQITTAEAYCGGSAMEYPMLTMNEPGMYSPYLHELDFTIAHETAHNWFYGMLGSDERAHPWLDEGFSQYIEQEYTDSKYPQGLFRHVSRIPWLRGYTMREDNELSYLARAWARDEQPVSTPADGYRSYPAYGTAAYSKPAIMLHTLRGILGDSVFTDFLRAYYRRNLLRHPRPDDVRRIAEEVSGLDLFEFFRSWVETLDRPSFALGRIRRTGTGTGWRTEVTVRRLEGMVLPITLEARFADGTRVERRVVPRERETVEVFEGRSRLIGAMLDPRHETPDMNRLDNSSGRFPPMRLHLLYGFPTTEAIGVDTGPTLWHGEAEGVRLGAWVEGSYLPSVDFPHGILGFEGGLSIGIRNGSVAYRAGVWERQEILGARGRVRGLLARDAGLFRAELHAGNLATGPGRRHPHRAWSVSLAYRDRDELDPIDRRYWSLGRVLEAGVSLDLETIGPRRLERLELSYRRGMPAFREDGDPAPDASYDWVRASVRQELDLLPTGGLHAAWSVAAGSAFRRVPLDRQLDIAEEARLDALPLFYANDRGSLRETDHFLLPGGGGVRGYANRAVLGQRLLAGSLELAHDRYPVFLFGDVGRVEASGVGDGSRPPLHELVGRTLADVGFGTRLGPVEVAFPVWLSHPERDESPWRFRWWFSVSPIRIPRP